MIVSGEDKIISGERNIKLDEKGFLNCKKCPRRFYTNIGFENHLKTQHGSDLVSLLDQQQTLPQVSVTLTMQTKNEKQGPLECQESNKSYVVHEKLTAYQCQECKRPFGSKSAYQYHINHVHKNDIYKSGKNSGGNLEQNPT